MQNRFKLYSDCFSSFFTNYKAAQKMVKYAKNLENHSESNLKSFHNAKNLLKTRRVRDSRKNSNSIWLTTVNTDHRSNDK